VIDQKSNVGQRVVYSAAGQPPETGVVTSENSAWVFVRFGPYGGTSQPCHKSSLRLANGGGKLA
jgi:hypothetical protein